MAENESLSRDVVRPGERAQALAAVEILLRQILLIREHFPDDDLETVTVYFTVVCASLGWSLRDKAFLLAISTSPVPEGSQHPVSARAVADSTALPRETVRRKLKALVADGRIVEEPTGFRIPTNTIQVGRNLEFSRRLVQELRSAPRRLKPFELPEED